MPLVIDNDVVIAQRQNIEAAMSTDPKVQELIRANIRRELFAARAQMVSEVPLDNDPRHSARAIRTSVYQKILAGNINILNMRKAHSGINSYVRPRKLVPGQRGGNRRKRSDRTRQIQEYPPLDRGFVLRFVNSGTKQRFIGFRNNRSHQQQYHARLDAFNLGNSRTGNRGRIASRDWFGSLAERHLGMAAENLSNIIAEELTKIIGNS